MNEEFEQYMSGVRLMMLILRAKDGGVSDNPDRHADKRIVNGKDEWLKTYQDMMDKCSEGYRIYSSVNERDFTKGVRELKRRQLDIDYSTEDAMFHFYRDIKNQMISCLAVPSSRKETKFLIDLDSEEDLTRFNEVYGKWENPPKILDTFPTKNGYHVIMEPFNPALLEGFQVKKDDMLLIHW